MKLLPAAAAALLLTASTGALAVPTPPTHAPLKVDPEAMDYRPFAIPAGPKAGASLKPQFDDMEPPPITVEIRAHKHADGSVVIDCDGGAGHLPAASVTNEAQQ